MRIGSNVFVEVAVVCGTEFAGLFAPVPIDWWFESLIEVLVMLSTGDADARGMVADIVSSDVNNGDAASVLVTSGGPLLAETSVSETEFGSISWLCAPVTNGGLPLLATLAETSFFSVSKTEFGSISWLGTCISSERFSDEC